jgi:hypothetical protein
VAYDRLSTKQIVYKYVPKALLERSNLGFSVPIDQPRRAGPRTFSAHRLSCRRIAQARANRQDMD